jgi:quinoprotein glucose dehydrogenase
MPNSNEVARGRARQVAQWIYAALLIVIGGTLAWLGGDLLMVGGSAYYLIAGLAVIIAGGFLWKGDPRGAWIYGVMLAGTYIWAIWEVGLDGWALLPRLLGPSVLGLWLLTPWGYNRPAGARSTTLSGLLLIGAAAFISLVYFSTPSGEAEAAAEAAIATTATQADGEWRHYGNDVGGTRFSPLAQITPANADQLEPAWSFRTGASPYPATAYEPTPLKIGNSLYLCTPQNDVIALDATTGAQQWRFHAKSDPKGTTFNACRGVTYFVDAAAAADAPCKERIFTATIDARLIALDANKGTLCPGFGKGGITSLLEGYGKVEKGYFFTTSPPQLVRGKLVLGGWIHDNERIDAPSGVVRAFDAVTGQFAWAFDVGRLDRQGLPGPGETFTLGTPNSWAPMSADEQLGLVYFPTGNPAPDWYGGQRRPFDEKFGSSVVAVEAETGKLRWSFQTTRHDLWDYDTPSQPTLYDMPVGNSRVPALIQPTKRGETFILDRRTGKPIVEVVDRAVPKSFVPGERASPTQPFSVGMPSFGGGTLTEAMMWGVTPIDQAMCRIKFRKARYEGTMTPPGTDRPVIVYPGMAGGSDWGSITIDRERDIMIINTLRLAFYNILLPRAEADKRGVKPITADKSEWTDNIRAQAGTPYAIKTDPFMSPLEVPCQQPPYGTISAVDMKTRKLLWHKPLGTARKSGPLGIPSMLPFTIGTPNLGGSIATRGGVTFIAAGQDQYFRAIETRTGRELWKANIPAGGNATPMTYQAGGRQYVLIAAGGHAGAGTKLGDYILAYALPSGAGK